MEWDERVKFIPFLLMHSLLQCLLVFNVPFTFLKGMLNVAVTFLIYKKLSPVLHR